ncbi:MAG: hypothetical protein ACOYO1_19975 [Bacteroidales bacterium]
MIFNSKGIGVNLNLNGATINKIDYKADSANVILRGKSINKYIK